VEAMPTPTENIVLNGYFSKITILIAILPCDLAGFYGIKLGHMGIRWFFERNGLKMPLAANYRDHVGEFGVLWGFVLFLRGWE